MSVFYIKIIACLSMMLDHIRYAIPETNNIFTIILGRTAFPLYTFLITQGYIHTSDLKKYIKRLILFGLISQLPFMLFRTLLGEWKMLNIMFTLLLGICSIIAYDKIDKKYISLPICILFIFLGEILNVDYGWFGVSLVLLMYIFKNNKIFFSITYICLIITYLLIAKVNMLNFIVYFIAYIIPLILIMFYNGKLGKKIKYFYYWFYPVHMIIYYLINYLFI